MTTDDITGDGWEVVLGRWYEREFQDGMPFRWAENNALCFVPAYRPSNQRLSIDIEPGPGVGSRPFHLNVFDHLGNRVAATEICGREVLAIDLTASRPMMHRLRLHVPDGGERIEGETRILNYRAFALRVDELPNDVVPLESGYRVGSGWYPLERFDGTSFRWVENDARIFAREADLAEFELDVEPGPSCGVLPLPLEIRDGEGSVVAAYAIHGRQPVVVPRRSGDAREFVLHADVRGDRVPGDSRTLNFRVFEPA